MTLLTACRQFPLLKAESGASSTASPPPLHGASCDAAGPGRRARSSCLRRAPRPCSTWTTTAVGGQRPVHYRHPSPHAHRRGWRAGSSGGGELPPARARVPRRGPGAPAVQCRRREKKQPSGGDGSIVKNLIAFAVSVRSCTTSDDDLLVVARLAGNHLIFIDPSMARRDKRTPLAVGHITVRTKRHTSLAAWTSAHSSECPPLPLAAQSSRPFCASFTRSLCHSGPSLSCMHHACMSSNSQPWCWCVY